MNRGYINNQAVAILNEVTETGMTEARTKARGGNYSANFGTVRRGLRGACGVFDGSVLIDDKNIASAGTLNGLIEISGWFKTTETGLRSLFSADNGSTNRHWQLKVSTIGVYFTVIGTGGSNEVSKLGSYTDGVWHYVRAFIDTNDATNFGVEVDGVENTDPSNTIIPQDLNNVVLTFQKLFISSSPFIGDTFGWQINDNNGLKVFYKYDSGSTAKLFESSGNNLTATISNYYLGFWGTQNIKSYQNDVGYTLSDGATYYYDNGGVNLIPSGELIPRDESDTTKCTAYLSNGTQADLQFQGLVPTEADWVNSGCFRGNASAFLDIGSEITIGADYTISGFIKRVSAVDNMICGGVDALNYARILSTRVELRHNSVYASISYANPSDMHTILNVDREYLFRFTKSGNTVSFYAESLLTGLSSEISGTFSLSGDFKVRYLTTWYNQSILFGTGDLIYNLNIEGLKYPLSEPIIDPANHTYFDKSGNDNHATLIDSSLANYGHQDGYHNLMVSGFAISDGVNYFKDQALTQLIPNGHYIPAHATISGKSVAYTTGGVLADLTHTQDVKSFLDCGTEIKPVPIPRWIQADTNNAWFDVNGGPIERTFDSIIGVSNNKDFADISNKVNGFIQNIRSHKQALTGSQLETEKRITNN